MLTKGKKMKNVDISFNNQMRQFRIKYEQKYMPHDMKPYWNAYQRRRFKESYFPAYKKSRNKKSKWQIFKDIIYLIFKWKCKPFHYFRYALYQKKYTRKDIDQFLPETKFYYSILPKINSEYNLLDNKNVTNDILFANGIPIPKCILKVINGHVFDGIGDEINDDVSLKKYFDKFDKDIISKYSDCGSGGKQIKCFKKKESFYVCDGIKLTYNELINNYNGWLFQEKIFNHAILAGMHPNSLNSFRVMTYTKNCQSQVLYVILKLGNNGAETDNAHTKGIYININMETGETEGEAYNEDLEIFDKHPFSKKELKNIKIPYFNDLISLAKKCALLFPSLTFVGWDIALTNKGFMVLEGNSSPGLTIIQRTNNGMEKFLRLYYDKN